MDAMVRNLRKAYEVGIDSLEWMSAGDEGAGEGRSSPSSP